VRPPVAVHRASPLTGDDPTTGVPVGGEVAGVEPTLGVRRLGETEAVVAPPAPRLQPITGREGIGSANHRRRGNRLSQSQGRREYAQPIKGEEEIGSANRKRGGNRLSQSQQIRE
jgi:hypothetical protein